MSADGVDVIAARVRAAMNAADLDQLSDLLDPQVTWGAPGDPSPSCQNRRQVLDWYARGKAAGRRGHVLNVTTHGDKVLVAMSVTSSHDDSAADRWQVLTVTDGRISDIRGYDNEAAARAAAEQAV